MLAPLLVYPPPGSSAAQEYDLPPWDLLPGHGPKYESQPPPADEKRSAADETAVASSIYASGDVLSMRHSAERVARGTGELRAAELGALLVHEQAALVSEIRQLESTLLRESAARPAAGRRPEAVARSPPDDAAMAGAVRDAVLARPDDVKVSAFAFIPNRIVVF